MPEEVTDEQPEEESHWLLVRQTPAVPERGLPAGLDVIRPLGPDEHESLRDAEKLFNTFGASWGWNRLIHAANEFVRLEEAAAAAAMAAQGVVNIADVARAKKAFHAVGQTLNSWYNHLTRNTATVLATDQLQEMTDLVTTTSARQATALCLTIAREAPESAMRLEPTADDNGSPRAVLDPAVALTLGLDATNTDPIEIRQLILATLAENEPVAATHLVLHEEALVAAGQRLMAVLAEIAYGAPALLPPFEQEPDAEESMRLNLRQIDVGRVSTVLMAVRVARESLRASAARSADGDATPVESSEDSESRSVYEDQTRASAGWSGQRRSDRREDSPEGPESSFEPAAGTESDFPAHAIAHLPSLLQEIQRLTTTVEQSWSDALADVIHQQNAELLERWHSFLQVLQHRVERLSRRLRHEGYHTMLQEVPLRPDTAAALTLRPDPQQHVTQLCLADVYVTIDLLNAMQGLEQPTALSISLPSGVARTWWEAGAFAQIADIAHVARRVAAEDDLLLPVPGDERGPPQTEASATVTTGGAWTWPEAAGLAARSLGHGLPEAAILFAALGVRLLIGPAAPNHSIPTIESLSQVPKLQSVTGAARTLLEVAHALGTGETVSLGVSVPLAHFWVSVLSDWMRGPEIAEEVRQARNSEE